LTSSALSSQAQEFIESALKLEPKLAVFDCDGTLWSGDAGRDFFYWEMDHGLISPEIARTMRARYDDYLLGEVDEEPMCAEMVTMNAGVACDVLYRAAEQFFEEVVRARVFPELLELTTKLKQQGCELWAVSSTNTWVVEYGAEQFGIERQRVLAACVHVENGCASSRILRVPTDELKAVAIREVIGRPVDAVFGNSIHDYAMLEMAKWPFCVNPNPDLQKLAEEKGWPVYIPHGLTSQTR
jgi:phosphoserine phosphatase